MDYNEALAHARIAHPTWSPASVEDAAKAAVLAQEKQAAVGALAEAVAAATDENGNFNWDALKPGQPAWFDDANPQSDFMASVVVGLEAAADKLRQRGDAAEKAEKAAQDNLRNGRIAPSRAPRRGLG